MSAIGRRQGATASCVVAGGRVWAPYGRERIDGFIAEGRVAASTPVGDNPEGDRSRRPGGTLASGPCSGAPASAPAETAAGDRVGTGADRLGRPVRAGDGPFEQLLGAHGPMAALGPGLWLVRAGLGPSACATP